MQNFAVVSLTAPQFEQVLAKDWPQFWQNLALSGLSEWQLTQTVKD
jgi:hypothetical protein